MQGKEVEVKVWLTDSRLPVDQEAAARDMAEILEGSGWSEDSRLMMSDTYLKHPCRDLASTDEAIRIRTVKDMEDGRIRSMLTYKGPKLSQRSKARYEREVKLPDAEGVRDILQRLGFGKVIKVLKERRVFTMGDMEACIDLVPDLGCFLEIEVIDDDVQRGENRVLKFLDDWELDNTERRSYLELLLQK
jgi:adenylate cyclase class 2